MSNTNLLGYSGSGYANSLAEFGQPQKLAQSGGWLLKRRIPNSTAPDSMGCYPMFACNNWLSLADDLDALEGELVSVAIVADPLGNHTPELLAQAFPDVARPFKEHLLIDFSADWRGAIDKHHVRNIRFAQKRVVVERVVDSSTALGDWTRLYDCLIARHEIKGLTAFSHQHFDQLLRLPDIRAYCATVNGQTAGMLLWMLQGDAAYYHLGAYDEAGYTAKASYALFDYTLNELATEGFRWVNLGGVAGAGGGVSGLSRFKEGWSNSRKPAYFCGRIINRAVYDELVARLHPATTNYFPAYRAGEFS